MQKFYIGNSVQYEAGAVLEGVQIQQLANAPTTPSVGQLYFHSGDDSIRIYDGAAWITIADTDALDDKAPLASPAFTGTPTAITFVTTDSSTKIATTEFVKNVIAGITAGDIGDINATIDNRVNAIVNAAAGTKENLDTLTEMITAIANNGDLLAGVTRKFTQSIGNGALTDFTITHNLNTRDIQVSVFETAAPYRNIQVGISATSVNAISLSVAKAPALNALKVIVVG